MNLAVDGMNGGFVRDNVVGGAKGSRPLNCPGHPADYTVGHAINVSRLQSGYVARVYDPGAPCP